MQKGRSDLVNEVGVRARALLSRIVPDSVKFGRSETTDLQAACCPILLARFVERYDEISKIKKVSIDWSKKVNATTELGSGKAEPSPNLLLLRENERVGADGDFHRYETDPEKR